MNPAHPSFLSFHFRNSRPGSQFLLNGFLFLAALTLLPGTSTSAAENSEKFFSGAQKYQTRYAEKLEALAAWCDENDLKEQAEKTRNWIAPPEIEDEIRVSPLPKEFWENESSQTTPSTAKKSSKKSKTKASSGTKTRKSSSSQTGQSAPKDLANEWESRFRQLRISASNDYVNFAKKTVSAGHVSLGFGLLMRALHENPDNLSARKILGYQRTKTCWQTDFEKMNLRAGSVWHEKFGWIPQKHVRKYENGQRFFNGQWISEEQDAQLHASIEKGWVVETGHFQIITDASIEDGVRVGQQLEKLYRVWKQLFLNYYATEKQIRSLFEKDSAKFTPIPRHRVLLFKSMEEYSSYLSSKNMLVQGSVGVYVHRSTGEGVSCFVAGEENDRTIFHEVTHQLFEESCKTNPRNGELQNYWAIEAASTFMESFHDTEDGSHAVGGFEDERVRAARIYFVNSKVFVPFEEFVKVNRQTWQNSPKVGAFYAQACGMAHFLVFYEHGKYRDAFGRILFDVYSGRDTLETVSKLTGSSYETLNQEYQEFISKNPEAIAGYQIME